MRQRRPLATQGATTIRWAQTRERTRKAVKLRSGGRCELCGASDWERPMEVHHVDGRGDPVRESEAMCTQLCCAHPSYGLGCHEKVQRHLEPEMEATVLWSAAERLAAGLGAGVGDVSVEKMRETGWRPHDALLEMIRGEEAHRDIEARYA